MVVSGFADSSLLWNFSLIVQFDSLLLGFGIFSILAILFFAL